MVEQMLKANGLYWLNTKGQNLALVNGNDKEVHFCSSDSILQGKKARLFLYEFVSIKALPIAGQPKVFEFRMRDNVATLSNEDRWHAGFFQTLWLTADQLQLLTQADIAMKGAQYRLLTDLAAFDDNLSNSIRFNMPSGSIVTCLWDRACDRGNMMFKDTEGKAVMFPAVRSFTPDGPVYLNPWLMETVDPALARCSA